MRWGRFVAAAATLAMTAAAVVTSGAATSAVTADHEATGLVSREPGQAAPGQPNAATDSARPDAGHTVVFSPGSSQARYRVQEVLLGTSTAHEIQGAASDVRGSLVVDANGTVLANGSHITIDLRTLQTDQPSRDEIVRTTTLDTASYPLSEFFPTNLDGFDVWPSQGEVQFGIQGDLLLHGVRRPVHLEGIGHFTPNQVSGTANGTVSLTDFGIDAPQLGPLVIIQNEIEIELDFQATLSPLLLTAEYSDQTSTRL